MLSPFDPADLRNFFTAIEVQLSRVSTAPLACRVSRVEVEGCPETLCLLITDTRGTRIDISFSTDMKENFGRLEYGLGDRAGISVLDAPLFVPDTRKVPAVVAKILLVLGIRPRVLN